MFDLGDEIVIESNRVPWLIWIQLLVMLLLLILLLSISAIDLHDDDAAAAAAAGAPPSLTTLIGTNQSHSNATASLRNTQAGENLRKGQIRTTSTSRGTVRENDIMEKDTFSVEDSTDFRHLRRPSHPCHFLGLAKQALLKCLGLDFTSESSADRNHRKDD